MKSLLISILLIMSSCGTMYAQNDNDVIYIPDSSFKSALISIGVDKNGDGEIQFKESKSVNKLNLKNQNISSVEGIKYFINLDTLTIAHNPIDTLDLEGMQNLTYISCYSNKIRSLDFEGLTNLKNLKCFYMPTLKSINVSGLIKLELLWVVGVEVDSLDLTGMDKIINLQVYGTNVTHLDLTDLSSVKELGCHSNEFLGSLDLTNMIHLESLYCHQSPNLSEVCIPKGIVFKYIEKDNHTVLNEECGTVTNSIEYSIISNKTIIKAYDIMGKEVPLDRKEQVIIIEYSDGSREKCYNLD